MKLSELKSAAEVRAEMLTDPDAQAEQDRTAFAHDVALRVIDYQVAHGLSQSALARQLGMKQPAIARLEAGDHEPSLGRSVDWLEAVVGLSPGFEFAAVDDDVGTSDVGRQR